jgi:AbrB family looped-hinge helix DNA binding protein
MEDQLFGQRADNPGDRRAILQGLVERVVSQHGRLMVDAHEYVFDDDLYPGWAATYRRLWEEVCGRGDLWVATPVAITTHWRHRHRALLDARQGSATAAPSLTGIAAPCDSKTHRSITEVEAAMRITSKGQVTIPVEIRERLGLLPNSEVEFAIEGTAVRITKARRGRQRGRGRSIVEHLRGKATSGLTTDQIMALTRGEK